ncbi:hypothetical protein J559_3179 [Acinetobacter sp. 983759]|uniref:hypothetical protein n=1 Tax=Acinetobacter sp. 983759 TaxID=1310660 RepID=UPI00044B33AE|nr:hypothetical protein [Acinetobacter sp. 983759]EXE11920.1 hypothetical protein J559_3179 [Acinetobacter sp. 983759]
MDIKDKQARWAVERPLFEAKFIHSHLLPFFNFNENTGDYEIKDECLNTDTSEDKRLAYEILNTGWVMWLRAKREAQAVPEPTLDAPARVGGGIFQKGIKWSTVIGAAQRHYEHELRESIKPIISPADMLRIATGELVLVPREPTEKMLNAARDWSTAKYGKPVGNDGSKGCYQAMIEAQEPTND